jgi:hypothetical protein
VPEDSPSSRLWRRERCAHETSLSLKLRGEEAQAVLQESLSSLTGQSSKKRKCKSRISIFYKYEAQDGSVSCAPDFKSFN